MGKNVQGGNKTKGMARKTQYDKSGTRVPESEEEKYAIVKSVSGNGRFRVETPEKRIYVGILPGSMRGHKKRNNYVGIDSIVIINDRSSWQTAKENSHADITYVYSSTEQSRLEIALLFRESTLKSSEEFLFQNEDIVTAEMTFDSKMIAPEEDDKDFNIDLI
jgi:translation initiation factor IF-1